ncbi:hypothetical protein NDU88_002756 [Pleurodeles waltl]|uniref:Uncharacterized protein n=1 Tax=Pleurodeles waltl TaxID=8319 RepID=A0AAV7UWJ2_PLEWA|nr:hypothetical protein NDU88_002756 [Pleurodeles waltl]
MVRCRIRSGAAHQLHTADTEALSVVPPAQGIIRATLGFAVEGRAAHHCGLRDPPRSAASTCPPSRVLCSVPGHWGASRPPQRSDAGVKSRDAPKHGATCCGSPRDPPRPRPPPLLLVGCFVTL